MAEVARVVLERCCDETRRNSSEKARGSWLRDKLARLHPQNVHSPQRPRFPLALTPGSP
ncbi:protein of unknown function [Kyrpidia spormannii]|uniref:Uncharacterized protein n=2 Tax=Kyrpidia spormannii TaxID=2055160 RepID=A0ACA8ZBF8_9BACL|nr:protein of unknown function [Kyrpidia spormannii]CAB3394272.1 protein of unknown function [Kyrpidia spormannii]